jgi:diguanylate cyclase (GGDEF)-like protein
MDSRSPTLRYVLAAYRAQLPEKLAQLEAVCRALTEAPWNSEAAAQAHRLAHNLAGSGATFGVGALSDAAFALEQLLLPLRSRPTAPTAAQLGAVEACLADMRAAVANVAADHEQPALPLSPPASSDAQGRSLIFLADDQEGARKLGLQLSYFGYSVHLLPGASGLGELVGAVQPAALILDLAAPAGELAGALAAAHIKEQAPGLPLIFLAQRADLAARLEALRAGGSACFPKPVMLNELVATLDRLANAAPVAPARVLIVDDVPLIALTHATILRKAGLEVVTVTDPQLLFDALAEQQPDLVLMDVYLPGCEGQELAALIRQQAEYHRLPIVFLSGETNHERQLEAIDRGGDDFLTKPVKPARLVSVVTSRIEQARANGTQAHRDGLLSYGALAAQLARELVRARGQGAELSLALLDVDHFKQINGTHGPAAGDQVLSCLARLLGRHLRPGALAARSGGDAFVIVLPGVGGAEAVVAIERLRAQFACVQHPGVEQRVFTADFSAGVAALRPADEAADLFERADAALAAARQRGRNRVLTADALPTRALGGSLDG